MTYSVSAFGQSRLVKNDTVYIYEEVIVYDTVYVYDTIYSSDNKIVVVPLKPKSIKYLQLDTMNNKANLLLISGKNTATIPINGIILNRNIKNLESMKKVSFLGLMLVAFQSMVFAQSDYGLSIGGGTWWSKCNIPVLNGKQISTAAISSNYNLGVYYKQHLQSRFTIETRLNYRLLLSNYSYKSFYPPSSTTIPDEKYYYLLWDEIGEPGEVLIVNGEKVYTTRAVGEEASTINYHNVEVPIKIGYTFSRFNPYVGMRYSLKMFSLSKKVMSADDGEYVTEWGTFGSNSFLKNCFGIIGGVNYKISDRFHIGLNYYHAFTKDYDYTGYLIESESESSEIISTENYFWKSRSVEISLSYSFRRIEKD